MTRDKFYKLCRKCQDLVISLAPRDTGNLAFNSIKLEIIGDTCRIYVDENQAPYMKYTNEPWQRGTNPNEGWFERAVKQVAELIAASTKGVLKE